jgi:hypothetical protein
MESDLAFRGENPNMAKCLPDTSAKKKPKGHGILEKEQQRAT